MNSGVCDVVLALIPHHTPRGSQFTVHSVGGGYSGGGSNSIIIIIIIISSSSSMNKCRAAEGWPILHLYRKYFLVIILHFAYFKMKFILLEPNVQGED